MCAVQITEKSGDILKRSDFNIKEILKFLVGGGSAVLTDAGMYWLLQFLGMDLAVAKAISFICGSIVGFIINKLWTFEAKQFSFTEIIKYAILYACTALINTAVNSAVLYFINIQLLGFLCATGVSTVLNFFGQKFFVFRKAKQ